MKRLPRDAHPTPKVTFELDGEPKQGMAGEPIACALLASGEKVFSRSIKYHRPRGPYCFAKACTHCLMRVDGVPNIFTCRTPLEAGMRVERQNAFPSAKHDVFASIDWLFPRGLDHHEMFAGVPVAEDVMAKVARKLAGLGQLPDSVPPEPPPADIVRTTVAIVGGGAAGSAAARRLQEAGVPFVLVERDDQLGGTLLNGPFDGGGRPFSSLKEAWSGAGTAVLFPREKLRLRWQGIGCYADGEGRFVLATRTVPHEQRMLKLYAQRFLFAPGGHPAVLPFENNDVPGVLAGRAVSWLLRKHGYLPGERAALVGWGLELAATAYLLEGAGVALSAVVDLKGAGDAGMAHPATVHGDAVRALGRSAVSGFAFQSKSGGKTKKVACDFVAVCLPPSPSFELARQAGAHTRFDPTSGTFRVVADEHGRTSANDTYVAGELVSASVPNAAALSGIRAAEAILASLEARP